MFATVDGAEAVPDNLAGFRYAMVEDTHQVDSALEKSMDVFVGSSIGSIQIRPSSPWLTLKNAGSSCIENSSHRAFMIMS